MTFETFNALPDESAIGLLERCLALTGWAATLVAQRPYASADDFHSAVRRAWRSVHPHQWLVALQTTPLPPCPPDTARLAERYRAKFGYPLIVAQADAPTIRAHLLERLEHTPAEESLVAVSQLQAIVLERLALTFAHAPQ